MDPQHMRETLERYLERVAEGDVDGVVDLMADDVSVEDPVGGPPATQVVGKENVRVFFGKGFERSRPQPTRTGPIRTTAGAEAAIPFRLVLTIAGKEFEIDVIDVVRFDAEGRIASLRAFWNAREMRPRGS